jgi:uncharacterized membrane protein YdjX (TVP38/TMEM64 family)
MSQVLLSVLIGSVATIFSSVLVFLTARRQGRQDAQLALIRSLQEERKEWVEERRDMRAWIGELEDRVDELEEEKC